MRSAAILIIGVLVALGSSAATVQPKSDHRPSLFKDSRQVLAMARAQGRKDVVLLIAATRGGAGAVASKAEQLGGNVRYRADDVDYLRVRVPIDNVMAMANFNRVEAVAVDFDDGYAIRLDAGSGDGAANGSMLSDSLQPAAQDGAGTARQWPPVLDDYPLRNPYLPIKDLDADAMRAQHPTWDGRGVTIALLDGNLDMLLPEFQTAYTVDGKRVPKIADYLRSSDPRDDGEYTPQWVDMRESVRANAGRVTYRGKTFTAPRSGTFRIGFFDERRFNEPGNAAYIDQDIDRNGNPRGDDGLFGVLWDEKSNQVWVDANRDLNFTDQPALTDYIKNEQFGQFGSDDPKTPIRESVGFAVQTDRKNKFVAINVGIYQHASGIMGAVVANREPKGLLEGIAPGARVVSIMWSPAAHGMVEGMIMAFRHPKVDLIVLEQSVAVMSIPYTLADARHPITMVSQRLTDKYRKVMFVPGNNMPSFGFVAEDGLAPGVVSVGGYQSAESYRINAGYVPEHYDNLHWGALSHGPGNAGALKPDLLAPSGQMSTDPGYRLGSTAAGFFQLPPGYHIGGGTSTATPMAAGAAALVLSAAKQTGVSYDAARLKAALTGSARYIQRLPAHEQGNGLLQVNAAYELLKQLEKNAPIGIVSEAPVKHKLSHLYVKPNVGSGIYEREGLKVGDRGERIVTFTRTSGPKAPMTFAVKWLGNDGTFVSADSVTLPLGKTVRFPVSFTATSEGGHSAILSLENDSLPQPAHRMLNTIVVPHRFTAENQYSVKTEVTPPVPGDTSVFVDVPEGVSALLVSLNTSAVRLSMQGPGRDISWRANCPANPGVNTTCSIAGPAAGVWEINLNSQAGREFNPAAANPLKAVPVTLTATIIDVGMQATPAAISTEVGSAKSFSLSLNNRLGKVTAEAASVALGSAFETTASISQGQQQMYEVMVPKGATSLRAKLSEVSDGRADLDIYLLDCTAPEKPAAPPAAQKDKGNKSPTALPPACGPRAKSDDTAAGGEVEVPNPKAGLWKVVVDAFAVPGGKTSYRYLDVFSHPKFGAVTVADVVEERASGASWSAKGNAWVAEVPEGQRRLNARVIVKSGAVAMPQRVAEGYDASGVTMWYAPIGSLDLPIQ